MLFLTFARACRTSLEWRTPLFHPPGARLLPLNSHTKVGYSVIISKIRFPHPISVADAICGSRFDLRDSKRRALENKFCVRICYVFLISKCRGDLDLGLCTTSVLVLGERIRDGKIRLKKTCFDAGKIGFCHCASVLQAQVPKLCTDPDLSLFYILILGTHSKFARINFLALGVYCPAGQSAFRRSRPQLKLGEEIDSSRLVDDYACKNQRYPTPP